jgi:hypothetical protein
MTYVITSKSELQVGALHAWATVHGLTLLTVDGLATDDLSSERIARQALTTSSQGLRGDR